MSLLLFFTIGPFIAIAICAGGNSTHWRALDDMEQAAWIDAWAKVNQQ